MESLEQDGRCSNQDEDERQRGTARRPCTAELRIAFDDDDDDEDVVRCVRENSGTPVVGVDETRR